MADGHARVAAVGDLNDERGSAPLRALLERTDLRDTIEQPTLDDGGTAATFSTGPGAQKRD